VLSHCLLQIVLVRKVPVVFLYSSGKDFGGLFKKTTNPEIIIPDTSPAKNTVNGFDDDFLGRAEFFISFSLKMTNLKQL